MSVGVEVENTTTPDKGWLIVLPPGPVGRYGGSRLPGCMTWVGICVFWNRCIRLPMVRTTCPRSACTSRTNPRHMSVVPRKMGCALGVLGGLKMALYIHTGDSSKYPDRKAHLN